MVILPAKITHRTYFHIPYLAGWNETRKKRNPLIVGEKKKNMAGFKVVGSIHNLVMTNFTLFNKSKKHQYILKTESQ